MSTIIKPFNQPILSSSCGSWEGQPWGWYLNCTFLFMPEKCPYLQIITIISIFNHHHFHWVFEIIIITNHHHHHHSHHAFKIIIITYISSTDLSCSSLDLFSSTSLSGCEVASDSRNLAMSRTSWSCFGCFNLRWFDWGPPYFSNRLKNLLRGKESHHSCFHFTSVCLHHRCCHHRHDCSHHHRHPCHHGHLHHHHHHHLKCTHILCLTSIFIFCFGVRSPCLITATTHLSSILIGWTLFVNINNRPLILMMCSMLINNQK